MLIVDFDNSGSVVSPSGTDPLSNRFAEVEHAFHAVARRAAKHELGAVLHFDSPTKGDVPPVPLSCQGLGRLRSGLQVPSDGAGSSALLPSLRQAVKLAETHPQHAATLVVLSDFMLFDANPVAALHELAAFPGEVHAVVLGSYMSADAFDPRITVTPIQREDPPGAVARALFRSLVAQRPGSFIADAK
ncbi:hypothetical protein [Nocardiopsis lambiniae]|uniref:VWA domain-containing protein n=1 Tax=Nocardiopsis lambiniae TaxID=3075539 RepID=A0ABU2MGB5_9ACTN|nr:hypothetical protein [Nocardiopsis sp. DSM 44743]MDT0330891.1 hypothetical protein [Nocardiopsis sp. DSM 44743]